MHDTIELVCQTCGTAAAQVRLQPLLEVIPGKILFAVKGAARLAGQRIDTESPSLGMGADAISAVIETNCIDCADAARNLAAGLVPVVGQGLPFSPDLVELIPAVDNKPEGTT